MIRNSNETGNNVFYFVRTENRYNFEGTIEIRNLCWDNQYEFGRLVDFKWGMFFDVEVYEPDEDEPRGFLVVFEPGEELPYPAAIVFKFLEDEDDKVIVDVDFEEDKDFIDHVIRKFMTVLSYGYVVTADMLRRYFCYQLSWEEMIPQECDKDSVEFERYYIQWHDIETLLDTLEEKNPTAMEMELKENWGDNVYLHLMETDHLRLCCEEAMDIMDYERVACMEPPQNTAEAMAYVILSIIQCVGEVTQYHGEYRCRDFLNFEAMRRDIEFLKDRRYSVINPLEWSDEKKIIYLRKLNIVEVSEEEMETMDIRKIRRFKVLDGLADEESEKARKIVGELEEKRYPEAAITITYSCYGGNSLYKCDWERSRDILLKLIGIDNENIFPYDKCVFSTLLGNIYYAGLCNDIGQDLSKAFYFYSLGAVGECDEALYRIRKMRCEMKLIKPEPVPSWEAAFKERCSEQQGMLENIIKACAERLTEFFPAGIPSFAIDRLKEEITYLAKSEMIGAFEWLRLLCIEADKVNCPVTVSGNFAGSMITYLLTRNGRNPMAPYYYCNNCGLYDTLEINESCVDLPERKCFRCGEKMRADGFDIPVETIWKQNDIYEDMGICVSVPDDLFDTAVRMKHESAYNARTINISKAESL